MRFNVVHINTLFNTSHVVQFLHIVLHVWILMNEFFVGLEVYHIYLH